MAVTTRSDIAQKILGFGDLNQTEFDLKNISKCCEHFII